MEHMLCKICQPNRRHALSEPHKFGKSVEEALAPPMPLPGEKTDHDAVLSKVVDYEAMPEVPPMRTAPALVKAVKVAIQKKSEPSAHGTEEGDPWAGCPHCAARREKWAAAAKRHRERKEKP